MTRPTYHHGDLRRALIDAATVLVRANGPGGVNVRELARKLDVSPAAIYRHFADRDAVLAHVARRTRHELARRMLEAEDRVALPDPAAHAVGRFLAVGRAYLAFAREEPHLLSAAFLPLHVDESEPEDPNPWGVLATALDELVGAGAMPPERRGGAEVFAWSAVHGYATLHGTQAFLVSGEPDPDEEALLEGIARSLGLAGESEAGQRADNP